MSTLEYRMRQLEVWLNLHFPTPYPVTVKRVPKIAAGPGADATHRMSGDFGECSWFRGRIQIRISRRCCRTWFITSETLIHEWAHAMVMPNERLWRALHRRGALVEHPDEYWLAFGRIYRNYIDFEGYKEVKRIKLDA